MKCQIVLVSDQVLQNLIPILMDRPDRVYFVVSPVMAGRRANQRLARQLAGTSIEVRECLDCPDACYPDIQAYANQVAERVMNECADAEIILNATGSNKLMSFGFVEAFRGIAGRILYTDTAHRRIEYLPSQLPGEDGSPPPPTPMANVLDVPAYLGAQGFRFRRAGSDASGWAEQATARKAVCKYLGKHIGDQRLQQFISTMNRLADRALERVPDSYEERLAAPEQSFSVRPHGVWRDALARLSDAGVVGWDGEGEYFRFADVASARFVRGGWLEEYAYHIVRDAGVFDVRMSVHGVWDSQQTLENELDVLACHMNQLLLIECKTLRYEEGQNDNTIAYKLDSLGEDARGLFGNTWLLSAREPSETLAARARRARIRIVGPSELPGLRALVEDWRG